MRKIYPLLLTLCFYLIFSSCNLINPKEDVPTFIQIDSVQVTPSNLAEHGSVSHKISDVWVYYDRELLGAFELPARIPVLAKSNGSIQVFAGIWDNGLGATRARYPFYKPYETNFVVSAGNTLQVNPIFSYYEASSSDITYQIENFEQGNIFKKFSGDTNMVRTNNSNEVLEGEWAGKLFLTDTANKAEIMTDQAITIAPNNDAYLEFNYKSEMPFAVKVRVEHNGAINYLDIISLRARDSWTKAYLNIKGFPNAYQGSKLQFYFACNLPSGQTNATMLIDNFKIIRFN
jgi:hypothetical protein